MKAALKPCGYIGTGGVPCKFKTLPGHRYCFWHEVSAPKDGPLVGQMVARFVQQDQDLEGFQLAGANLERRQLQGAHLVKANLEGARLYRANLDGAHLFGANLKDANLYYASLADANVRSTTLTGANLLGARHSGARFDGSELGKHSIVVNEHKANREAQ
ncbi:MAG: pentapeptide repeat-containing protein, partial [FCB group bacterium]|nr:pentapeptide repeat-containing protein [FCB group bacterium]